MDPKQLALAHFEKAILAVFGAWLVMSAIGLVSGEGAGDLAKVGEWRTAVEERMKEGTVEEEPAPTWTEDLRNRLAGSPSAREFPGWVLHRRPQYLYQLEDTTPQFHAVHRPPVNLEADAETRGQIEVRWSPSVENEYVEATYKVMRREGEDGEWLEVKKLGSRDETRYVDTDISSLSKYYYQVISTAVVDMEDPIVKKHSLKLADSAKVRESDTIGPVGTKREIYVWPISCDPVTEEELIKQTQEIGLADVKVKRWINGAWVEKGYWRVKVGDGIGKDEGRKGNFVTGATLIEVRADKRESAQGYTETIYVIKIRWPDGKEEEITNKDVPEIE